jgi:hypothetical protein
MLYSFVRLPSVSLLQLYFTIYFRVTQIVRLHITILTTVSWHKQALTAILIALFAKRLTSFLLLHPIPVHLIFISLLSFRVSLTSIRNITSMLSYGGRLRWPKHYSFTHYPKKITTTILTTS